MFLKSFSAKCDDRTILPKSHPAAGGPEDWYANDILVKHSLFGISFDFFIDWSCNPSCITPVLWIKRILDPQYTYRDILEDQNKALVKDFGEAYLQRFIAFATDYDLAVQLVIFRDDYNWQNEVSSLLIVNVSLDEFQQLKFSYEEISIESFKALIRKNSGGSVRIGSKGLTFGTSILECFLSKTDSLYPGDADMLLLNEHNHPIAILEFKKHNILTPIDEQKLSNYYPHPDGRKYDRIAILRDFLSKVKMNLPVIIIYYPTIQSCAHGRMELIGGSPGNLYSIAASNFDLLQDPSLFIKKTLKAIDYYSTKKDETFPVVKKFIVENVLIDRVGDYLRHNNIANRGVEDGDIEKQTIGLLGELTVYKYLFNEYPDLNLKAKGFDGGYDIVYNGQLIDVKTMGRNSYVRPDFVNNFYLLQSHHNADTVIFCSYHINDNVLEICGWLPKNELATRGIYFAAGTKRIRSDGSSFIFRQDNYEIQNKNLNDIELLKKE